MVYSERTIGSERAHLIHVEMNIRVASVADLDDILRIQALAYGEYFNEPAEALMAKMMLANESSFVALRDDVVCAYAIAFPCSVKPLRIQNSAEFCTATNSNE